MSPQSSPQSAYARRKAQQRLVGAPTDADKAMIKRFVRFLADLMNGDEATVAERIREQFMLGGPKYLRQMVSRVRAAQRGHDKPTEVALTFWRDLMQRNEPSNDFWRFYH